ncbi:MAG: cob(I)yrinic acid a,c-diamide adenosyltransferase [Candidatus Nanoarchaeia archaeon]|jgi:ATP:cob(I)alamin adenosyltransferase|nr:cob(I)yrinic acid a,c-diamide adenosyltransferase [Candidatus Nanoarchaeia archaeon]
MVITTKFGDGGKTQLLFGKVVSKSHPRMHICGTIDEANAQLGVARAYALAPNLKREILSVQEALFTLGAEIATAKEDYIKLQKRICKTDVQNIDDQIAMLENFNDIDNWFIPGEIISSAHIEVARTIVRRLERYLYTIEFPNKNALIYINRVSDYLWLLSQKEEYYVRGMERKLTEKSTKEHQRHIFE